MFRGFFKKIRASSQTGANSVEFSILTVFGIMLSVASVTGAGFRISESFSPSVVQLAEGGGSSSTLAASELTSENGPTVTLVSPQIVAPSSESMTGGGGFQQPTGGNPIVSQGSGNPWSPSQPPSSPIFWNP